MISYSEDYRILAEPFNLEQLSPSRNTSVAHSQAANQHNASQIFATDPSPREESTSLKLVLMMMIPMLVFQILCMFVRHHFLNVLVYLSILSIFFLNYFDKNYMRFCLILTAISIIWDLLWLITRSDVSFKLFSIIGMLTESLNIQLFRLVFSNLFI